MNPNINNICSFLTSIAEGHLYQSFYHQRMGLLRLGLVSECRFTKNTTNDTNFSDTFFHILNIIVDYFNSTITSADAKQLKWLLIPKVSSIYFSGWFCYFWKCLFLSILCFFVQLEGCYISEYTSSTVSMARIRFREFHQEL